MPDKVLLREFYELCPDGSCEDLLTESEKKMRSEGVQFLSGKLQEADCKNGNGRVYEKKILEREVENYQKAIKERRALGELDHPEDQVINLKNASHLVTKVWWDGPSVMGKIQVLATPAGKVLTELINAGIKLGISSRGLGSVEKKNGKTMVKDDFQLICFDIVSEPSTPDAFMNLSESKNRAVFSREDRINRILNSIIK